MAFWGITTGLCAGFLIGEKFGENVTQNKSDITFKHDCFHYKKILPTVNKMVNR